MDNSKRKYDFPIISRTEKLCPNCKSKLMLINGKEYCGVCQLKDANKKGRDERNNNQLLHQADVNKYNNEQKEKINKRREKEKKKAEQVDYKKKQYKDD